VIAVFLGIKNANTGEMASPVCCGAVPSYWWSMILSENRYPLFGIML